MKSPALRRIVVPTLAVIALGALVWWIIRPRASIDRVDRLLAAGRFDEAEGRLLDYLRANPDDQNARLILARASVERPDPKPDLALEQLRRLRPANPQSAAALKSVEGDAQYLGRRYDAAEASWLEALRLDPKVPEVGFRLLNIYAIQGRDDDSRRLALRLFVVEPDPHDRVQLLLQSIRHDAHAIEVGSIIHELGPVVDENPGDVRSALALGHALVRIGRQDEGLEMLREAVESHRDMVEAWDAYLWGLREVGRIDELARALADLPPAMAADPRADASRGAIAAHRLDWEAATRAYRRAWEARPSDTALAYRLGLALRNAKNDAETQSLTARLNEVAAAFEKLRDLYDRLNALPDVEATSNRGLFAEVAAALEPLGRVDEAWAWTQLSKGVPPGTPLRESTAVTSGPR
jgi:tetratricopeptide (TPR) repeat protein